MKKTTAALIAALILIACIFTACNGTENGKVTDNNNDSPVLTTIENMITDMSQEVSSDISEMFSDNTTQTTLA